MDLFKGNIDILSLCYFYIPILVLLEETCKTSHPIVNTSSMILDVSGVNRYLAKSHIQSVSHLPFALDLVKIKVFSLLTNVKLADGFVTNISKSIILILNYTAKISGNSSHLKKQVNIIYYVTDWIEREGVVGQLSF